MHTLGSHSVHVAGSAMALPERHDGADVALFFDRFGDCTAAVMWENSAWHFLPRAAEDALYPPIGQGSCQRVILLAGAIELPATRAVTVEFHDADGLAAVAYGHFAEDMWIYAARTDDDWKQHLLRIGIGGVVT